MQHNYGLDLGEKNMNKLVVGLMSGTSLDGIDASLLKISGSGLYTKIEVLKSVSIPYDEKTKQQILEVMDKETSNIEKVTTLNVKLGYLFSKSVFKVCQDADVEIRDLSLIGSHGQTVYHIPRANEGEYVSTLQLGDPSIMAYETNTTVVSNFRPMDMASGGEGAPLIPYVDWLLFQNSEQGRIMQNIGGIGNCTVLEKNSSKDNIFAFDTGPGNMIIDSLCRKLYNEAYDEHGEIAETGEVHSNIVSELMQNMYFKIVPPKTTGREEFGEAFVEELLKKFGDVAKVDLIATATYFTAYSIAEAYKKYVFPYYDISEIIISGGGANNPTLISMMRTLIPDKRVTTLNEFGITSDEKEAVGFAILAHETVHQQKTNIPNATGAKDNVILGQITLAPAGDSDFIYQSNY